MPSRQLIQCPELKRFSLGFIVAISEYAENLLKNKVFP